MARTLVVVESAAKSRTIQQYLGNGYIVRACFGHVRDLPVAITVIRTTARPDREIQPGGRTVQKEWRPEELALVAAALQNSVKTPGHWRASAPSLVTRAAQAGAAPIPTTALR